MLKGSAQLTTGDVNGDIEAQDQFPPKSVNPEREGTPSSLSQKSGHLKNEGVTGKADRGNEIILHSELCCARGPELYRDAKSIELCMKCMVH